jgi:hypothetical protein
MEMDKVMLMKAIREGLGPGASELDVIIWTNRLASRMRRGNSFEAARAAWLESKAGHRLQASIHHRGGPQH